MLSGTFPSIPGMLLKPQNKSDRWEVTPHFKEEIETSCQKMLKESSFLSPAMASREYETHAEIQMDDLEIPKRRFLD